MKLDTSSYYPKSPLDDDDPQNEGRLPETSARSVEERVEETVTVVEVTAPDTVDDTECEPGLVFREEDDVPPGEAENFITAVAHVLSWVLVPLLMPVYGVMLSFGLSILVFTSYGVRLAFTGIVAGFNVVIPAVLVLVLKKFGMIHDIGLNGRKERFLPYIVSILCLVGTALFMHFKAAPVWLVMFFFGGAVAGVIEVIINRWWKISVHAAGIAGVVALLVHMFVGDFIGPATEVWLLISVGLAGLLGSARIWLGRHTLGQVLAGYVVGFCSVFFMMMIR